MKRAGLSIAALLAFAQSARGQDAAFDLQTFRPAPGGTLSLLTVERPDVARDKTLAFGAFIDFARNPLYAREGSVTYHPVSSRTAVTLLGSYSLIDRFEVGAVLPVVGQSGDEMAPVLHGDGLALVDPTLHAKALALRTATVSLGGSLSATVPIGDESQYAGSEGFTGHARAIVGLDVGKVQLGGNVGYRLRHKKAVLSDNVTQGNEMTYGLGGAMRLIGRLDLIAELYGAVGMVNNASGSVSPLEGIGALRFRIQRELAVTAGGGGGILPGVGAPDFRVFVAMAWSPGFEPIGKGLLSRGPQLASATKKTNRPYDPRDDDKDGIINSSDDCPEEAEDEDNWADHDGCPELDNDKDGIADSQDRCPAQPEDHDNFKDEDGCVDPDDDGDGVADVNDRCPDTVEDMDGFRDKDGCDDPDNDKDGVPDVVDQCVLEPETINGNNDDDGCPDPGAPMVLIVSNRFELAQPVVFVGDGTKIDSKSHSILKQLSLMVRAKTEITKLRIAAHVHARKSRTKDMTLSKKRAEVVKKFLVDNGVEVNRIELQPFGSTRPIEKGDSKSAQAINDRIEFIIDETSVAPGSKIKITD